MIAMPHAANAALRVLADWSPAPAALAVIVGGLTLALAAAVRRRAHSAVPPTSGDSEKIKNKERNPGGKPRARLQHVPTVRPDAAFCLPQSGSRSRSNTRPSNRTRKPSRTSSRSRTARFATAHTSEPPAFAALRTSLTTARSVTMGLRAMDWADWIEVRPCVRAPACR